MRSLRVAILEDRERREAEIAEVRKEMERVLKLGPFASNAEHWQVWCEDWHARLAPGGKL